MAGVGTGDADPARTLALLWRQPVAVARHGPAQRLSVDAVVDAAIALADSDGLVAVSMRRLADRLSVAAMTLYTYVPTKGLLLDLMLDSVYAAMQRQDTSGQGWRSRVTAIAEENRALFEAHSWAVRVASNRPPLGPGQLAKYEHELSALEGLGLPDVEQDAAVGYVLGFVRMYAIDAGSARAARRDSDVDDQQWWAVHGPLLARLVDPARFATAVRVGAAAGAAHGSAWSAEHAWSFGLARVLDGLAALIEQQ